MQFVPGANQICKRARPPGSWFPLISTVLWSFSGRGWKARPSLVAQLGGLLCFLKRLNYSTTEISRLARFSPFFSFLFFPRELTIRRVYQCPPWHDTTQKKNKDWRQKYHIGSVNIERAFHNNLRLNQIVPYSQQRCFHRRDSTLNAGNEDYSQAQINMIRCQKSDMFLF